MINKSVLLAVFILFSHSIYAEQIHHDAVTQSLSLTQLAGYGNYPPTVQQLIANAATLTEQHLTYTYGSADPKNGGMDCSGTIFFLLKESKVNDVPRQANEIYEWAWQKGQFYAVNGTDFDSFEFSKLKPGDLLFWTGTYDVKREPPITHVMMYLGKNQQNQPLMFGASDGRTYQGKQMWGVSVFDFKLPNPQATDKFIGYSCIPNLTCKF